MKAAVRFFGFQKATSEPAGKKENLWHDIQCPITNPWANRVATVNTGITRHLTLAKVCQSTLSFIFSCTVASDFASLFVASSLFVIYLLLFVILPVVLYSHLFILIGYFKIVSAFCLFCHSISSD
jgi:hypothetical protein